MLSNRLLFLLAQDEVVAVLRELRKDRCRWGSARTERTRSSSLVAHSA